MLHFMIPPKKQKKLLLYMLCVYGCRDDGSLRAMLFPLSTSYISAQIALATVSYRIQENITLRPPYTTTPAMGWLMIFSNDSTCRKAGHTTPTIGWLIFHPNDSCWREVGHTTPTMGWLNFHPKVSSCKGAGHTTLTAVGWLK